MLHIDDADLSKGTITCNVMNNILDSMEVRRGRHVVPVFSGSYWWVLWINEWLVRARDGFPEIMQLPMTNVHCLLRGLRYSPQTVHNFNNAKELDVREFPSCLLKCTTEFRYVECHSNFGIIYWMERGKWGTNCKWKVRYFKGFRCLQDIHWHSMSGICGTPGISHVSHLCGWPGWCIVHKLRFIKRHNISITRDRSC